jgi:hypothetical protein
MSYILYKYDKYLLFRACLLLGTPIISWLHLRSLTSYGILRMTNYVFARRYWKVRQSVERRLIWPLGAMNYTTTCNTSMEC